MPIRTIDFEIGNGVMRGNRADMLSRVFGEERVASADFSSAPPGVGS